MRTITAAALAAVALVCVHLAAGGGDFSVSPPPPPCAERPAPERGGTLETAERVGLVALGSAACELGVSRERLVLILSGEVEPPPGLSEDRRSDAFRSGLRQAVDAEERAGRIGGTEAFLLRGAIDVAPVDALLERLFGGT